MSSNSRDTRPTYSMASDARTFFARGYRVLDRTCSGQSIQRISNAEIHLRDQHSSPIVLTIDYESTQCPVGAPLFWLYLLLGLDNPRRPFINGRQLVGVRADFTSRRED